MLIDYLARAPAKVIVYDVVFSGADTRSGFPFGGTTWTGAESDQALADSVKTAGNVIVPVDATFEGAAGRRPLPCRRRRIADFDWRRRDRSNERSLRRPTPLSLMPRQGSVTTSSCSMLTGRCGTPCRLCESSGTGIPSLGLIAAVRSLGLSPGFRSRRRRRAANRRSRDADVSPPHPKRRGRPNVSVGAHQLSRASSSGRSQVPAVSELLLLRSALFRAANPGRPEADRRSGSVQRQARLRRSDRHRFVSTRSRRRSPGERCRACRYTPASPTTFCRIAFYGKAARRRASRPLLPPRSPSV